MTLAQLKTFVRLQFANGAASMASDALETALNTIISLVLDGAPLAGNQAGLISDVTTNPGTPTTAMVYVTVTAGSYTHFLSAPATPIVVPANVVVAFLTYNVGTGYWVLTSIPKGTGYVTGSGGAVTQSTSKATGVTLNKSCGAITTHNASLAAGATVSFTVTNSTIAATDVPTLAVKSSGAAVGLYHAFVSAVGAGSFQISITNLGSTASEVVVINFANETAVVS